MDRKQFEEWFKTTLSYAIFEDSNVWKVDLYAFNEPTNSYLHSGIQAAFESWQHQHAKVEGLQEEFAEDERFLKEQIQQKELEISNLKYLQSMDKELIQALQSKSEKLQKRVDAATCKWIAVTSIATTCPNQLPDQFFKKLDELHDALCGVGLEQALKGEG